jgi:hypothetical protein
MERYEMNLDDAMPYVDGRTMTVREFRGKSGSNILWTDRRAMEAWNALRSAWGKPVNIGFAFRRIGENGHAAQSQHYAGVSFDVAQSMSKPNRDALRSLAEDLGVWGYVEPARLTPTWVHFDRRTGRPACSAGYPVLKEGARGVYAAVLQDALSTVGVPVGSIDGIFGPNTKKAVRAFQRGNGLVADGVVGCGTWSALAPMANGAGTKASTYIN